MIFVACQLLCAAIFLSGLPDGETASGAWLLSFPGGAIAAWGLSHIVRIWVIGPFREAGYAGVADRLRARIIEHSIRDWRGWESDTPGVAALVQGNQLFLCDYSTRYDELLLSSDQIGPFAVKREPVETRKNGRILWRPLRSTPTSLETTFLEIHYQVRDETPMRVTRIPFGSAARDAEGWEVALERAKWLDGIQA